MDITSILQTYGLPTVIISAVITLSVFIINRVFGNKIPIEINGYIPFVLGIIIFIVYDMIAISSFQIREEAICSGLVCGSLSGVICAFIKKPSLIHSLSNDAMAIYTILEPFVETTALISLSAKVEGICKGEMDEKEKLKEIANAITVEAKEEFIEKDFTFTAKLCMDTVKNIK